MISPPHRSILCGSPVGNHSMSTWALLAEFVSDYRSQEAAENRFGPFVPSSCPSLLSNCCRSPSVWASSLIYLPFILLPVRPRSCPPAAYPRQLFLLLPPALNTEVGGIRFRPSSTMIAFVVRPGMSAIGESGASAGVGVFGAAASVVLCRLSARMDINTL